MTEHALNIRPRLGAPSAEVVDTEPSANRAVVNAQVETYQRHGIAAVVPGRAAEARIRRAVRRPHITARAADHGHELVIWHGAPSFTTTSMTAPDGAREIRR